MKKQELEQLLDSLKTLSTEYETEIQGLRKEIETVKDGVMRVLIDQGAIMQDLTAKKRRLSEMESALKHLHRHVLNGFENLYKEFDFSGDQ